MTTGHPRPYGRRMTDTTTTHTRRGGMARSPRPTAYAWIAGGLLWLAAGLVHDGTGPRFELASALWLAADVLIAAGIAGLLVLRPHGASRVAAVALVVAFVARLSFGAGEVASLVQGHDDNAFLPVGALLTALAMTVHGVVLVRRREVAPRVRAAFLAMGLYPLLVMFPVVAATGEPSMVLVALWGLPAVLIGVVLAPVRAGAADDPVPGPLRPEVEASRR